MNKKVLDYINRCEGWKTAIKSLHWDSNSLSQHELCDDIAERIADFQDQVSEVEQSITGKLPLGNLKPTSYKVTNLKKFVEDVLDETNTFYKSLESEGDTYTGMRSDCESFLSDMQRNLYLVNFTMKEDLKRRLRDKINESMPKNPMNVDDGGFDKFMGRRPKTIKARINQIYKIVKKYGIDSRVYHDEHWQAIEDYYRAITSLGCEVEMKPCGHIQNADSLESDGGYCDYAEDGMPRSKQYAIKIVFDDGMSVDGYIKCMAAGSVQDPFDAYDTCMVLWPKSNRVLEGKEYMSKQIRLTEAELKEVVKEAAMALIREYNQKQANTERFIKSTHGHRGNFKKEPTPEERAEARRRLGIKDDVEESIEIDDNKKGTFTAAANKHGETVQGFASKVLKNKDNYSPAMVKKANFAKNAKKWKH